MEELSRNQVTQPKVKISNSLWVRWLCIILAWLCILIGTIGIVVPGLPTVDFYLLASFFAAKGSARLHAWMYRNRYIGPILQNWHDHRAIPRRAKVISLLGMSFGAVMLVWKVPHPYAVGVVIFIMILVQIWMWTRPEPPQRNNI